MIALSIRTDGGKEFWAGARWSHLLRQVRDASARQNGWIFQEEIDDEDHDDVEEGHDDDDEDHDDDDE